MGQGDTRSPPPRSRSLSFSAPALSLSLSLSFSAPALSLSLVLPPAGARRTHTLHHLGHDEGHEHGEAHHENHGVAEDGLDRVERRPVLQTGEGGGTFEGSR